LALAILHFLFLFFTQSDATLFTCRLPAVAHTPWTLLTYVIAQPNNFLSILFNGLWLWWVGGSLERSWGSQRFGWFVGISSLITSVALYLGCLALQHDHELAGLSLPIVAMTVAWAAINPFEELTFNFIFKVKAWQLGALVVIFMLFVQFSQAPLLGLFALLNPIFAYYWTKGVFSSIPGSKKNTPPLRFYDFDSKPKTGRPLDDLQGKSSRGLIGMIEDWRQRKRLEKLWKDSGFDDKNAPKKH
jgi:membrane associated rhomboid family serine protease